MILLIDNYDSFAHNLARYFRQLEQPIVVHRNDALDLRQIEEMDPECIVISPGPCTPNESGNCLEIIEKFSQTKPILGICLGHQAICQAFGARIVQSRAMHGRIDEVFHTGHPLFDRVDSPFKACRYHSLIAERNSLPSGLEIVAENSEKLVMAIAHRTLPVFGLQFHPESILTDSGYQHLSNFLRLAGLNVDHERVTKLDHAVRDQQMLSARVQIG